jgi:toxin ParE1/3/4
MGRQFYTVKVTSQAQEQLAEIFNYISETLQAPSAALHLLNMLESEMASLDTFPYRIALIDEEPWRSYGIRKMSIANFLVYFWIDEEVKKVQITAVIYYRRNQEEQLAQMEIE